MRRLKIAEQVASRLLSEMPALQQMGGDATRYYVERDVAWVLEHLSQAIALTDPILFHDHIAWAKSMMVARGLKRANLKRTLELIAEVLDEDLSPAIYSSTITMIEDALQRLDTRTEEPPGVLNEPGLHADCARDYTEALLAGNAQAARRLVREKVRIGTPVADILLHVIEPAQVEVGRLWQINRIDVAQEHFATAVSQDLMSELTGCVRTNGDSGTVVSACVEGELHDTGLQVVNALLQLNGWATHYLGANTPKLAIQMAVRRVQPEVLALSVTTPYLAWRLPDIIAGLRSDPMTAGVKVLVGGYPFHVSPSLAKWIGADGTARNAEDAVLLAGNFARV
ncbi:cobalamin B12-binding domain-containing protein [Rhodovibrio salinarum]|nr:cobalamin-dependent protein [Rhodovibrio salinarum]